MSQRRRSTPARTVFALLGSLALLGANTPPPLPMDVWYAAVDDNGLPLNPIWQYQHEGRGLPDAGVLCDHFPNRAGTLYVQNCTTQQPVVDEPRPFHGIIPNDRYFACAYLKNVPDDLRSDSVHGHVNWTVATYTGTMSFTDFGFPPFTDGDWDWLLKTEDRAGYLRSNDPRGIIAEFSGAEVADRIRTDWWSTLRQTVMTSRRHQATARAAAHDLPAIVTGILGIDTKHTEHAEVHPVFGLALRTGGDGQDERWDLFARNWGNEGGCSNDQHNYDVRALSFFFPDHGSMQPELVAADVESTAPGLRWGAVRAADGLVATFELPNSNARALDYGTLHLCYAVDCKPIAQGAAAAGSFAVTRDDAIAVIRHRVLADGEPRILTRDSQ